MTRVQKPQVHIYEIPFLISSARPWAEVIAISFDPHIPHSLLGGPFALEPRIALPGTLCSPHTHVISLLSQPLIFILIITCTLSSVTHF
jgi:hypothetical protein